MKHVLILEPYYGGSHKHFLEGLQQHVSARYVLFTLPARKWKMRMQLSAPWFIEQIKALSAEQRWFDTVLCSSFVDVAVLRALLLRVQGWNHDARICIYFHENQMTYPQRHGQCDGHQFASINFHSALVADAIAFNSSYNAETFLSGCRKYLKSASSEFDLPSTLGDLQKKSRILFPGIDFQEIDKSRRQTPVGVPVIVWNHRWEHDKNPEGFYQVLTELKRRRIDFRLIVAGKSFSTVPDSFIRIQQQFAERILHFGFVSSYRDYIALLCQGDIVVSTALHEFYGIAVIEAVRAGCIPLLPDRLSYPELFDNRYLYSEDNFVDMFERALLDNCRHDVDEARRLTERFSWHQLAGSYSEWLFFD
ncbi:MAG: glycosyltransferase [Desulfobulbaceae bacterium BRH_c16a]|nr:MAG: glycosyltransferase [Desulfobulbaceae bacterium BRH_c16a]